MCVIITFSFMLRNIEATVSQGAAVANNLHIFFAEARPRLLTGFG